MVFGINTCMNYCYPMQECFAFNGLMDHFVCFGYSLLELGVIDPMDYPHQGME